MIGRGGKTFCSGVIGRGGGTFCSGVIGRGDGALTGSGLGAFSIKIMRNENKTKENFIPGKVGVKSINDVD